MRKVWSVCGALAVGICAASRAMLILPQEPPVATVTLTTQPAAPPERMAEDAWRLLAGRLQRGETAAVKELEHVPGTRLAELRVLAEKTLAPEVTAAVRTRIFDLRQAISLAPLPITVDLRHATQKEAFLALANAAQVMPTQMTFEDTVRGFDLSVRDKPYWEVFAALYGQTAQARPEAPVLVKGNAPADWPGLAPVLANGNYQVVGPLVFCVAKLAQTSEINYQGGGVLSTPYCTMVLDIAVDPRVRLMGMSQPMGVEVVDDTGAAIGSVDMNDDMMFGRRRFGGNGPYMAYSGPGPWQVPILLNAELPRKGKTIKSFKARVTANVELQDERQVTGVEQWVNKPIEWNDGKNTLTVTRCEIAGGDLQMSYQTQVPATTALTALLKVIDADGAVRAQQSFANGVIPITVPAFKGPVTVRIEWGRSVVTADVPFELRDIPLP